MDTLKALQALRFLLKILKEINNVWHCRSSWKK